MAILGDTKTDDNASTPTNTGSTAPAKKDSGVAAKVDYGAAPAASAGAFITGFLALQNGSSLEQKIARAGIDTDSIWYIV